MFLSYLLSPPFSLTKKAPYNQASNPDLQANPTHIQITRVSKMDTRKRKRLLKPPLSFSQLNVLSLKTLLICFCFILLFVLLSQDFRFGSGHFRPARIVTKIPTLTSSLISNSVHDLTNMPINIGRGPTNMGPGPINFGLGSTNSGSKPISVGPGPTLGLRIEERVVFPDHVLVVLSANGKHPRVSQLGDRIDCVYHHNKSGGQTVTVSYPMISADEYDGDRWIVRCPVPPGNDTVAVGLKRRRTDVAGSDWIVESEKKNMTVGLPIWDTVAYEAAMDGDDVAVVFAKGFNLRSGRISDPDFFTCHFMLRSSTNGNDTMVTSSAITAAQEVVRCPLPVDLRANVRDDKGVRVTVEKTVHLNTRRSRTLHQVMPTIARLFPSRKKNGVFEKYKLCACTMVWNQAEFVREWIMYHSWLGVERWFIYDNNSDDGLKEVVDELDSENYNVTRHVWPWVKSQEAGFAHCVLRARDECSWVGFFDVDEFYYLPSSKKGQSGSSLRHPGPTSLRAIVENVSLTLPSVAEIRTDCLNFGPSGLKKSPKRGVSLGYTCRLRSPERHKSIIRPDGIDKSLLNQVHHFRLKKGFSRKTLSTSVAVINHYKYQVWNVFKAKFYRRVSTYVADWQENQNEHSRDRAPGLGTEAIEPPNWHLRFCKVWDNRLRDFILTNLADSKTGLLPWEKSVL